MKKSLSLLLTLALFCSLAVPAASAAGPVTLSEKYTQYSMTEEQRYLDEESYWTPAVVADVDGDGKLEALAAAYTLTVMDASNGTIKWQAPSGQDRNAQVVKYAPATYAAGAMHSKIIVADLDKDGAQEIVVGYTNGTVSVLTGQGYFKAGWPQSTREAPVRSLAAADVDGDGKLEVIAGLGVKDSQSLYVFGCDGKLKPGWPQIPQGSTSPMPFSYCDGLWADSLATGDMDGDGIADIVAPTDNFFINAFHGDGTPVLAGSTFEASQQDAFDFDGRVPWGAVGLYEDYEEEIARKNGGWGMGTTWESLSEKGRKGLYGPGMGSATAIFADVDGNGTQEIVVTALMNDRTAYFQTWEGNRDPFTAKDGVYQTVYIYNTDHTRFKTGSYNWETIPNNQTNPALGSSLNSTAGTDMYEGMRSVPLVADVDGDGVNEIVFNTFDGKVHCYSLKDSSKELPGWPYSLPQNTASLYEFPAAPAAADLDGDGKKEVIFGSFTTNPDHSNQTGTDGALYVVGSDGKLVASTPLHKAINFDNGCMTAPVVMDVDGDNQYEILVNTRRFGLCAYDVNGSTTSQTPTQPTQPTQPTTGNAIPTNDSLSVDGKPVTPAAYKIDNANFFKLRDVAMMLNGTAGQFSVDYDGDLKAVKIVTGQPYSPQGGELKDKPTANATAEISNNAIYINGEKVELTVYKINGQNFFGIRDLGSRLGFNVGWEPGRGMFIESDKPYNPNN